MNHEIKDFIGVFKGVFDEAYCKDLINLYETIKSMGFTTDRQQHDNALKTAKDNEYVFLNESVIKDEMLFATSNKLVQNFIAKTWDCYRLYQKHYGILSSLATHQFYPDIKIQKINKCEGYHVWHCEHSQRLFGPRLMLVIAYLNTVEEGGETEFLYQSRRIKPEQGSLIMCPSGFTHTHRGNPPLTEEKYIINGWLEFTQ
jgi:hypothetical protein